MKFWSIIFQLIFIRKCVNYFRQKFSTLINTSSRSFPSFVSTIMISNYVNLKKILVYLNRSSCRSVFLRSGHYDVASISVFLSHPQIRHLEVHQRLDLGSYIPTRHRIEYRSGISSFKTYSTVLKSVWIETPVEITDFDFHFGCAVWNSFD